MPHQGSLLAVSERQELTPNRLMEALQGRQWVHREVLALSLGVSVRAVREAAKEAQGAILSGNRGLRLTVEASEDDVAECLGRFQSQVSEMVKRICATKAVWESRNGV